jgi:uncharacterized protein YdeI (YjbR/CyaY-like superfamily)
LRHRTTRVCIRGLLLQELRMPKIDPRVDAYIERSAEFAQPILTFLRETVHGACPDAEETLKWGMPTFMYHGILCSMAAFKQYATFGFWLGRLVVPEADDESAMGHYGRITHCRDLPTKKVIVGHIKLAMKLNVDGVKTPRTKSTKPVPEVPDDLSAALKKNRKARATFEAFSPSHRREYIEWIIEAKRADTRQRRLEQAIEWLAEGKQRHWKYMNC